MHVKMGADSADWGFGSEKILDRCRIYDCRFRRQRRLGGGLGGMHVKMGADSADWGFGSEKILDRCRICVCNKWLKGCITYK